jgi:hypothetical protein
VPVDETLPTIAGSTVQGQTLTDGNGSWSNSPTGYLYQWQRCDSTGSNCSSIANANGPTYALTAAELGATIRMVETAFNTGYGLPATSAQTAVVSSPPPPPPSPLPLSLPPPSTSPVPVDLSVPTIAGQPAQSRTLTESHGTWSNSPIGYLYQWERCNGAGNGCSPITGATGPRYQLNAADVGSSIRVVETASNSAGLGSPATSSATLVVKPAPPKTSAIHAQINPANHRATFRFAAKGHSTGFQCALVLQPTRAGRKAPSPRYLACGPKKTFTHLATGRYVLYVRAVGPGGVDKTPVRYTFTIS